MSTRRRYWLLALSLAFAVIALAGVSTARARRQQAHAADAQQCADPYPATRDPSNPLDLPTAPGADPLTGAQLLRRRPAPRRGRGRDRQAARPEPEPVSGRLLVGALRGQPRPRQAAPQARPEQAPGPQGRAAREARRRARGAALQPVLGRRRTGRDLRPGPEDLLPQPDRRPGLDPDHHHVLPVPGGVLRVEQRDHRPPPDVRAPGQRDGRRESRTARR